MFKLLVVAIDVGFYGGVKHYPADEPDEPRAGGHFYIGKDALKYDAEGALLVDKDLRPILPSWVAPVHPQDWKPVDKGVKHKIVESPRPRPRPNRRQLMHVELPEVKSAYAPAPAKPVAAPASAPAAARKGAPAKPVAAPASAPAAARKGAPAKPVAAPKSDEDREVI